MWEERSDRLARHGSDYTMAPTFKKVALKKMLTGKTLETYDLREAEKLPFAELLKRIKGLARAKKLDTDVARGRAGVTLGATQAEAEP